jgi:hypothetical protein
MSADAYEYAGDELFLQEAAACYGDCGVWECDGRVDLSVYGEDFVAECGVWMDVEGYWVYTVRDFCDRAGLWEASEEGVEEWGTGCGLGYVQRAAVHFAVCWVMFCE